MYFEYINMKAKEARLKMFCRTERHKRVGNREKGHIPYHLLFGMSLAVVMLFAGIGIASATDYYYVATWGNDSNNGTSLDEPWQSPYYAAQQAQAGDTIYLMDGTWYYETIFFANDGTDGMPIIMKAYNSGKAILDGVNKTSSGICLYKRPATSTKSHLTIDGRRITHYNYDRWTIYGKTWFQRVAADGGCL